MENNLINVLSAWLAPILAIVVITTSIMQYILAAKKRKDDLFDKRYNFYKKAEKVWLSSFNEDNPPMDIIDLLPLASEATFLFGKEVSKHIISFEGKKCTHPWFADDDFAKPFYKYLKLK